MRFCLRSESRISSRASFLLARLQDGPLPRPPTWNFWARLTLSRSLPTWDLRRRRRKGHFHSFLLRPVHRQCRRPRRFQDNRWRLSTRYKSLLAGRSEAMRGRTRGSRPNSPAPEKDPSSERRCTYGSAVSLFHSCRNRPTKFLLTLRLSTTRPRSRCLDFPFPFRLNSPSLT